MLTTIKRIFNLALIDFWRNRGVSVAAIFVLVITTLAVTGIFIANGVDAFLVQTIQNKIDITAYFKQNTTEQAILAAKDALYANVSGIKDVEYVSADDALAAFAEKHKENPVFSQALDQVGGNPFLPSLNITTKNGALQYQAVADFLQKPPLSDSVEKIDFSQKKDTIESIFALTNRLNTIALILAGVLALIVLAVVFNTMRLVIQHSGEEITTMRVVGASAWFIRWPFIIEGAMFGVVSFLICFFLTAAACYFCSQSFSVILPGFSLFGFFMSNIGWILLLQLGSGVGLGAVASYIVVRKYLR